MRSDPAGEMIEEEVANKMQNMIEDDADLDAEVDVKELWKDLKDTIFGAVKGRKLLFWPQSSKISKGTMNLIKERTQLRLRMQRKKVVPEKLKLELREIRKKVRLGIKKDRIQFFEDIAKEAEIASRIGDSKGVFSALRKATGTKGGAVDLRNADVDKFVQHFQDLVGVSESKVPEECKSKKAWKIAEEWLGDKSRYEKEWEVDSGLLPHGKK